MPYNNTYAAPTSINRPSEINPGGLCSIIFFLWEDVAQWPSINPATGIISDSVVMKAGKSIYTIQPTETERYFKEEPISNAAGPAHNIQVNCRLGGNTNAATLALGKYQHHQFGLIVKDRNGEQRLIGNDETGARISYDYTSGDFSEQRIRNIKWIWQSSQPVPIYHSGGVSGVVPPVCAQYYLVDRFRVGAVDAPMDNGDTTYTNAALIDHNFLLFADGIYLIQVTDNPGQRYVTKAYNSDTITFNGGVAGPPDTDPGEVIEIWRAL